MGDMQMYIGKRTKEQPGIRCMLFILLTILCLACTQASFAYTDGDPEYRAFWVDAWHPGALNQAEVDSLLGVVGDPDSPGEIRLANCNTVFVQVRRNADALYPSSLDEPYMSGITPADFNGLQAVINAAHDTTGGKQRIEVHAWIVTFRTGGGAVYSRHSDPPTGSLTELDNYWISLDDTGAEVSDKAFDPGHPKAAEYIVDLAMDLVTNFDIDGIHFDYVRFTSPNQGYNPTSVARYNARYGLTGQPDALDAQFQQWRRDQITAVMRQVYAKIQATKPWVKHSVSLFCGSPSPVSSTRTGFEGTRAFYEVYSDWDRWLEEGIVDMAMPMTYFDYDDLPNDYDRWLDYEKDRHHSRHMIIGPGLYLNSLSNSILELQKTREPSASGNYAHGFCGFSYHTPYSGGSWAEFKPSFVSALTSGGPVSVPDMPWKSEPTKGHISGTVTYEDGGAWADGAMVTLEGPESRSQYCDGTGFYAFIDVTPGPYTITVTKPGYTTATRNVTVELGQITGNMYVNDFQLAVPIPLIISDVAAQCTSATSASITWTTNQPATSQVAYGTTTEYGSSSALDSSLLTSHTVNLSGLEPSTTYHFIMLSTNSDGNAQSEDLTFTTPALPEITDVVVTNIGGTTATVTWTTSQACSSQVQYGPTAAYGLSTAPDSTAMFSHSVELTGLSPGTTYHYRVVSGNDNGTVSSDDATFTTAALPVISSVQAVRVTDTAVNINWTTDVPATSQVEYGPTLDYGFETVLDTNAVTEHSVALTGLAPDTTYNYRVKSTTAAGTSISSNHAFNTGGLPVLSNIAVAEITAKSVTITWTTDQPCSSNVNYGPTSEYGWLEFDLTLVTAHCITITRLTPATEYHFQCTSTNEHGTSFSADYVFTTPEGVPDVIVDNSDPGWRNTSPYGNAWNVGNLDSVDKVGADYLYYKGDGKTTISSKTRRCMWTPDIQIDGLYDVLAFYQTGYDRSKSAPFKVYYYGGSINCVMNQKEHPSVTGWYMLAENLPFAAGTSGFVELSTLTTDGTGLVGADAVKFVYKGPIDLDPPAITISEPSVGATARGPVTYTVTYDDAASISLTSSNVILNRTGTAKAKVSVSGTGLSTRTITLSSISGNGTIGISLAAGTAKDAAGNKAAAAGPAATFVVDNTAPTVSIGPPSAAATASGPIDYVVTYTGADLITLSPENVKLSRSGSATGTVSVIGEGNETRIVRISDITGNGSIRISLASGTATDAAGNRAAATTTGKSFAVDNTPPTVSIGKPSVTSTTTGPVKFSVTYKGATSVDLSAEDVILHTNGDVHGTVTVTTTGTYTRAVTVSSITGSGTLNIAIAADTATDAVGNGNLQSAMSPVCKVDNTPPLMVEVNAIYVSSSKSIKASWEAIDFESNIRRYEYAVGTTPLGTDVKGWTSAGTSSSANISRLPLVAGNTYYVSVRAINAMNLVSEPSSSPEVVVETVTTGRTTRR